MLIVNVKENESIDKALKRFKKKFEKTGVLKELRARTSFEKPSITRRSEIIRAAYREQQKLKETQFVIKSEYQGCGYFVELSTCYTHIPFKSFLRGIIFLHCFYRPMGFV